MTRSGAAADSVAELGSDAIVLWAWFDRHVEPLPEGTSRPSAPRAVVGDTNYLAALSWARDRINAYPDAIADVVLVTDSAANRHGGRSDRDRNAGVPR